MIEQLRKISKNSPLPLYYQLKELLLKLIVDGKLKTGDRLPAERKLAEYQNVSRMTVKKAVDELVNNGYLIRKQGSGTFVAELNKEYQISPIASFSEEMKKKDLNFKTELLKFEITNNINAAEKLNINTEDQIYYLQRLRIIDEIPFLLENTYLPAKDFPSLEREDLQQNSLFRIMKEKYGCILSRAEAEVEPVIIDKDTAEKMRLEKQELGLYLEQFTYSSENKILEYTSAHYRSDSYKFKLKFRLNNFKEVQL
ncbi:MAG: GntR family transcriptional regulator [Bacillota bacterium]